MFGWEIELGDIYLALIVSISLLTFVSLSYLKQLKGKFMTVADNLIAAVNSMEAAAGGYKSAVDNFKANAGTASDGVIQAQADRINNIAVMLTDATVKLSA